MSIEDVFSMLQAMYGSRMSQMWKDSDPSQVKSVWASALGQYSENDIRSAFSSCMTAHLTYPPTLPEFVALCRARRRRGSLLLAAPREKPDAAGLAKVHAIGQRLAAKWRVGQG